MNANIRKSKPRNRASDLEYLALEILAGARARPGDELENTVYALKGQDGLGINPGSISRLLRAMKNKGLLTSEDKKLSGERVSTHYRVSLFGLHRLLVGLSQRPDTTVAKVRKVLERNRDLHEILDSYVELFKHCPDDGKAIRMVLWLLIQPLNTAADAYDFQKSLPDDLVYNLAEKGLGEETDHDMRLALYQDAPILLIRCLAKKEGRNLTRESFELRAPGIGDHFESKVLPMIRAVRRHDLVMEGVRKREDECRKIHGLREQLEQ